MNAVVSLDPLDLALASSLVLVDIGLSIGLNLGLHRGFARSRGLYRVSIEPQRDLQGLANGAFVITNQHASHG